MTLALLSSPATAAAAEHRYPVIPNPRELLEGDGSFALRVLVVTLVAFGVGVGIAVVAIQLLM